MSDVEVIQALKAAKECINVAIKDVRNKKLYNADIAIDNARECLTSARNKIT